MIKVSNEKTKIELGLRYVQDQINVLTPFGRKRLKNLRPYKPGSEGNLQKELDRLEELRAIIDDFETEIELIHGIFMAVKDIRFTLERSAHDILTVVEFFEIKNFLLQLEKLESYYTAIGGKLPSEYFPLETVELLNQLDPEKNRLATFYIYDSFSNSLGELRKEKKELERNLRKNQKKVKHKIRDEYEITLTPKFDYTVSKAERELVEKVKSIPELIPSSEDYVTITYMLKQSDEQAEFIKKIEDLNLKIEEEEFEVRRKLTDEVSKYKRTLLKNCDKIGELDFVIAKAEYARKYDCVKPVISQKHMIKIKEGRYIPVEDVLESKGKTYMPISIELSDGVTCITGANMGGKTVSMKLVGLHAMLAQYGFFVPCKECMVGLSSYIHILVGDSQDIQKGLSSFGSEMEELRLILEESKNRSLIFIDEIASSTNPTEGFALTKSLVRFLLPKPYITLITTHYENVASDEGVNALQVRGLKSADFKELSKELDQADEEERIEVITKYMDYSLEDAKKSGEVPKDALNIAMVLGVDKKILNGAKDILGI